MIVALLITPVGIGLVANGSRSTDRWETFSNSGDRLGPNIQIVGGAILLLLVAALAAYAPTGTVVAGWVWGLIPGAVALLFPGDTLRAIRDIPALPIETRLALSVWATDGGLLLIGALLLGAGLASAMRRR
ncbi:hypothetical protein [Nocardia noduli]|uniref:hypothetical protein n=1 Tax=Nocardia noduli TaxID=2815722 RepID=UPI001C240105|nr:hypothetical protein [Nocardia noduli]